MAQEPQTEETRGNAKTPPRRTSENTPNQIGGELTVEKATETSKMEEVFERLEQMM